MASLCVAHVIEAGTKVTLPGKTASIEVPPLACGTWSWGDSLTWKYNANRDLPGIEEAWNILNGRGAGFFDTAEVYGYGLSETIIGTQLAKTPAVERANVIIATKWFPVPILPTRIWPRGIIGSLKGSLARLGIAQVDLYQVHGKVHVLQSIESVAKDLARCVNLGLAKTVGVSNYSKDDMITMYNALAKHGVPLASNQIEFSLLRRLPETSGLIAAAHERSIVPLAYSPLAQGRLSGKYTTANPPPTGRAFSNYPMDQLEPLLAVMRKIANARNVPVSAVGLNWIMCKGAIPLAGARNGAQAKQNSESLGWRLMEEMEDEILELEKYSKEGRTTFWQKG